MPWLQKHPGTICGKAQSDSVVTGYRPMTFLAAKDFAAICFGVSKTIHLQIHAPGDLGKFRLPAGVQHRLAALLDRQDQGAPLSAAERKEAEGLVDMAEMLSLLKLRVSRTKADTA
jgi:hypothetical protein